LRWAGDAWPRPWAAGCLLLQEVTVFNSLGFPYFKYEGHPVQGITLHADLSHNGKAVFQFVTVG
jgi:hypothetical protein